MPNNPSTQWPQLLSGEFDVLKTEDVGYLSTIGKMTGVFVVTNYRLHFQSYQEKHVIDFPLTLISRLEKIGYSTMSRREDSYGFEIVCKDFRNFRFSIRQENHSRRPLYECLQRYAYPLVSKIPYFAFSSAEHFPIDGWCIYDPTEEFRRLKIPNKRWRITKVNSNYQLASTYPSLLCVPDKATDEHLCKVATFRSRHRIPVCSWLHPNGQVSLTRSSQPSVGVTARRSHVDEQYLKMIIDTNDKSKKLYVMDARPAVNAKANKAKGGGYESESAYPNAELVFLDIENIHVMRESLKKLRELCVAKADNKNWLSIITDTNWLEHLKLVLCGAARIVDRIENAGSSVLVHCSDGWDRTSQLTSLAMLMLDPYYRTTKGFEVLVEKEWCSFGHKFGHRIGHGEDKPGGGGERSPIFLQFLDCVHQLTEQFPNRFQFNARFLIAIMDHVYSCRFGTFLYNNERERAEKDVYKRTKSLWSYLNGNLDHFTNPKYNGTVEGNERKVLMPCCSVRQIRFWTQYYLRWNPIDMSTKILDDHLRLFKQIDAVRLFLAKRMKKERAQSNDSKVKLATAL